MGELPATGSPRRVVGRFRSTVTDQYVPYILPQEHGHRSDVRWLWLTDEAGFGLVVEGRPTIGFTASHFTAADLYAALHTTDLEPRAEVMLSLDHAQRGLGTASCGPDTAPRYQLNEPRLPLRLRAPGRAVRITGVEAVDVRFPTSRTLDGSDAMNPDPDYSAAYVILAHRRRRSRGTGSRSRSGGATRSASPRSRRSRRSSSGSRLDDVFADMGAFWRRLTGDRQLRWLGPEKGVIHLATAAIVNAVWDLYAKSRGQAALEAARPT